jgi:DNA-binding GntR family transcriptional regulator
MKKSQPTNAGPTLNEEAYRRLEEMIVTLDLAPGEVVSEAILSARLGIGHTPIREALQRLAREHLVQILPRRGVIVARVDVGLQLLVLETRRELDRLIARAAVRRATVDERKQFKSIAQAMAKAVRAGDMREFLRTDNAMNAAAGEAARNTVAAVTVATLHSVSRRFWYFHHVRYANADETLRFHVEFARALAAGDEDTAARASDALIDDLVAFARSTVTPK